MTKRLFSILIFCFLLAGVGYAQKSKKKALTPEQVAQQKAERHEANINRIRDLAMKNKHGEAYQRLIGMLKEDIDEGRWENAAEQADFFRHFFGDYHPYHDLMRTLTAPYDTIVKMHKFPMSINSESGSEYSPTITGDGKTIYFCGRFRQDNIGSEDIYVAHKHQDYWLPAQVVRELSSEQDNEAPESVSLDGQTLIVFSNGRLSISQKTARGWSKPEPLPRIINNSYWQADAMLSADGQALLFAAKKQVMGEERESMNLFVSVRDERGNWTEPKSLGPTINTPMDERSPVLYSDMKTLYFCSTGHSTLGGFDVFKTTRKYDDSWTEWTEPVNIGKEINTTGDDCWYKITTDGTTAYFAKASDGQTANAPGKVPILDLHYVTLPRLMRPDPVSTISGTITDIGGKPLPAIIVWEDLETHKEMGYARSDVEDGKYFITLPAGKLYGYFVEKQGYWPASDYVDLRIDSAKMKQADGHIELDSTILQHEENITLASFHQMREEGIPVRLNNIFFDLDKAELRPESITELYRTAYIIRTNNLKIEVGGHTDIRGTEKHNLDLSRRRAEAVMNFLIDEGGCSADRVTFAGYGASQPVAPNDTEEHMQLNRRVEVKILK